MRTPTTPVTAEEVRVAFARRGITVQVRETQALGLPAVLQVQFVAAWPFPLPDGNMLSHGMTVDPWRLGDLEGWVTYALQRAEADLLTALLPTLVDRARLRGVNRVALAPFAREVVEYMADRLGPEQGYLRHVAAPYTDADRQGDQ